MDVSIIIPAFNSDKTIEHTIQTVLAQGFHGVYEVIVVDDGSTDQTATIVKKFPSIVYVYQENAGPASARNNGAMLAKGEFLFFTDADCQPQNNWVERLVTHFNDSKVAAVSGSYGISNPGSLLAYCIHQEIKYRHNYLMPRNPKVFGSYNFCIRKKIFEEVGGFDIGYRNPSGEDNDLSYKVIKAGYKIYFENESIVNHYHPTKATKYLIEQFRHGFWRVRMYLQHPSMFTGDNYTFWKDIVEIPFSFAILLACALSLSGVANFFSWALGLILILWGIELFFAFRMMSDFLKTVFYSSVMFLRSFARALGFLWGIILILKINKKK